MIEIKEVFDSNEKSCICNTVLRSIPSWFGIESSIVEYVRDVQNMIFYAAYNNDQAVGFVAIKTHNIHTSEICVMGIIQEFHRQSIGKSLVEYCENYCRKNNMVFLTVKTLDGSVENESYKKTRFFYEAMGFKPLEVFPLFWDKNNPCLFLAKYISN